MSFDQQGTRNPQPDPTRMPTPPDLGDDYSQVVGIGSMSREQVLALQQFLANNGFNPGPIDGIFGPRTAAALYAFQDANGMARSDTWSNQLAGYVSGTTPTAVQGGGGAAPPATTWTDATGAEPAVGAVSTDLDAIREAYPEMAFYVNHPEIGPILARATANDWDSERLRYALVQTDWWRTRSGGARQWEATVQTDPASAQRLRDARRANLSARAAKLGITIPPDSMHAFVEQSLMWGWSDDEITMVFGMFARKDGQAADRGTIGSTKAEVRRTARDYLIQMSEADANEWAIRIAEGTATLEGMEQWARGQAKVRFGWLSSQIDSGVTPSMHFAQVKNRVAQVLEMNPEDIDLMNGKWTGLTEAVDANGNPRGMTLTEAEKWARMQPEWDRTTNAREGAMQLVSGLGQIFGKAAI